MGRGGTREGAGRKGGARNKRTEEQVRAVEESGLTPLEYLLQVMRSPLPPEIAGKLEECAADAEMLAALAGWHDRRMEAAKAAAPYVHPKLVAAQISGPGGGDIPIGVTVTFVKPDGN